MKRQLTWKGILLSILVATVLVVVATLAVTLRVGPAKASIGAVVPKAQTQIAPVVISLCMAANKVTTLAVRRGPYLNPTVFSFPAVVLVENAASARLVAKAICDIPPDMRTGAWSCPADQGLTYQLTFTLPRYVIAPVLLRLGGCGGIEGTGAKGWIHPSRHFYRVLGNALRLHLATGETFAGKMS